VPAARGRGTSTCPWRARARGEPRSRRCLRRSIAVVRGGARESLDHLL